MNYYPFHIGDYLSATRHLSWEEDAAYRRLLDVYYTTEKPLPLDHRQACRLVLATTEPQREAVQTVLDEFFEKTEAGWINRRCDEEIVVMRDKQQKQRDKANKRWHKPEQEPGNAPAMPRHDASDATASKTDANAMPPTPTPTPTPNKRNTPRKARCTPMPEEFGISQRVAAWAQEKKFTNLQPQFDAFVSYVKRKGATYVDWDEALMTAIRDDWAKVRGKPGGDDPYGLKGAL